MVGRLDAPILALASVREAIRSEGVESVGALPAALPDAALGVPVQLADVYASLSKHEAPGTTCRGHAVRRSGARESNDGCR